MSQACTVCSVSDVYRKAEYADLCTEHHLRAQVKALTEEKDFWNAKWRAVLKYDAETEHMLTLALSTGLQVADGLRAELAEESRRADRWSMHCLRSELESEANEVIANIAITAGLAECERLRAENRGLREALENIAAWEGAPHADLARDALAKVTP